MKNLTLTALAIMAASSSAMASEPGNIAIECKKTVDGVEHSLEIDMNSLNARLYYQYQNGSEGFGGHIGSHCNSASGASLSFHQGGFLGDISVSGSSINHCRISSSTEVEFSIEKDISTEKYLLQNFAYDHHLYPFGELEKKTALKTLDVMAGAECTIQ